MTEQRQSILTLVLLASLIMTIVSDILRVNTLCAQVIDLSGKWNYRLMKPDSAGSCREGQLILPGTLDSNLIGFPPDTALKTEQLWRKVSYCGPVKFSRVIELPDSAAGKTVLMEMERTRPSYVKVDGIDVGSRTAISSPHLYDLTEYLSPGRHEIEITIDNSNPIPESVRNSSHSCSESTQTNWNGIIGKFEIRILDSTHITYLTVIPQPSKRCFTIRGECTSSNATGQLQVIAIAGDSSSSAPVGNDFMNSFELTLPVSDSRAVWSEWNPETTDISVSLIDCTGHLYDKRVVTTGLGCLETNGKQFEVNGVPTFLRGRTDACVWPLTAHPPMNCGEWERYFSILKAYGLNHVRFHSWCPPEACFSAADKAGFYLQPELPIWGALDPNDRGLCEFLASELKGIMESYGHHPSFAMFSCGNELWGGTEMMKGLVEIAKDYKETILATYATNVFLGWDGELEGEDYITATRTGDGYPDESHVRGSFSFADSDDGGIINATVPGSVWNYSKAVEKIGIPVISHEIGQYQSYPDFDGLEKYTGVLLPGNYHELQARANRKGYSGKTKRFRDASGKWASRLYKAEMEAAMRTPGMAGFELLDIADYPGQGTSTVGMLDAFMDSKGFLSPGEWRKSCSPVTLMVCLPKFTYVSGDTISFKIKMMNAAGKPLEAKSVAWSLPFASGNCSIDAEPGLSEGERMAVRVPDISKPERMEMTVKTSDGSADNTISLWFFPKSHNSQQRKNNILLTDDIETALEKLRQGGTAILFPDSSAVAATTVGSQFATDFWNSGMYNEICRRTGRKPSPGTLGLCVDSSHPLFKDFPTDSHTDWQWYHILASSRPLVTDRLPSGITPIVEVIDNPDRGWPLSLVFECRVCKGKLLVIMADLDEISSDITGQWFIESSIGYVGSSKFKPNLVLTERQLKTLLTIPSASRSADMARERALD